MPDGEQSINLTPADIEQAARERDRERQEEQETITEAFAEERALDSEPTAREQRFEAAAEREVAQETAAELDETQQGSGNTTATEAETQAEATQSLQDETAPAGPVESVTDVAGGAVESLTGGTVGDAEPQPSQQQQQNLGRVVEQTPDAPPQPTDRQQQQLQRIGSRTPEPRTDTTGQQPQPQAGGIGAPDAGLGEAAGATGGALGGVDQPDQPDVGSGVPGLEAGAAAAGQTARDAEQGVSQTVGRGSPASETARDVAATGLDVLFQNPEQLGTGIDVEERTGDIAVSGPAVVADVAEGQLFESGERGDINREVTESLTEGRGLFESGTTRLESPGQLETPGQVQPGTNASQLESQIVAMNPGVDTSDVSVSQGELGQFSIQTDLSQQDIRERVAAANPGVEASDVSFQRQGGEVVPVTGEQGTFWNPTEFGLEQTAEQRQEFFGVGEEARNVTPEIGIYGGVTTADVAEGVGTLPGEAAAAPPSILLGADLGAEVAGNAPETVEEFGTGATAETTLNIGGSVAGQTVEQIERRPGRFVGQLGGGVVAGSALLRGLERGTAGARARVEGFGGPDVDARDLTRQTDTLDPDSPEFGRQPTFETDTGAPGDVAAAEARRRAREVPPELGGVFDQPAAAGTRVPDIPGVGDGIRALGRGAERARRAPGRVDLPDAPSLDLDLPGVSSPALDLRGRLPDVDTPSADLPDVDTPDVRGRVEAPFDAAEGLGFRAGRRVGETVAAAEDTVTRPLDRAEDIGFGAGQEVGERVGAARATAERPLDAAENLGFRAGERVGEAAAGPLDRAEDIGFTAGAAVGERLPDRAAADEQIVFRSESERLPSDLEAQRGTFELPGLFGSPDFPPLRTDVGRGEGSSLSRPQLRLPRLFAEPERSSAFEAPDIESMPAEATGTGFAVRGPGGDIVDRFPDTGTGAVAARELAEDVGGERVPDPATGGAQFLDEAADRGPAFVRPAGSRTREFETIFAPGTEFERVTTGTVDLPGGRGTMDFFRRADDQPDAPDGDVDGADTFTAAEISRRSSGEGVPEGTPVAPAPGTFGGTPTATPTTTGTGTTAGSLPGATATPTGTTTSTETTRATSPAGLLSGLFGGSAAGATAAGTSTAPSSGGQTSPSGSAATGGAGGGSSGGGSGGGGTFGSSGGTSSPGSSTGGPTSGGSIPGLTPPSSSETPPGPPTSTPSIPPSETPPPPPTETPGIPGTPNMPPPPPTIPGPDPTPQPRRLLGDRDTGDDDEEAEPILPAGQTFTNPVASGFEFLFGGGGFGGGGR